MQSTYTVEQAARVLQMHRFSVIRWIRSGKLPGAYMINRNRRLGWRIPTASVRALLEPEELDELSQSVSAELAGDQPRDPILSGTRSV